jgi:valyl-tRNA synthetase
MMMMGIHFMGDIPFKDVYVHALVRDKHGDKMSKSKGNVIDPLTVIDEYGTDAFRYTLAAFAAQGRDIRMDEKRVEGYRHFINKIWNAARFALPHLTDDTPRINRKVLALPDRWILSRLNHAVMAVADGLNEYRFNDAAGALYRFIWHEFCDWYLEAVKPALYGDAGEKRQTQASQVMGRVLKESLVLLHPFAPFVSEEIWHKLPGHTGSIMTAVFPDQVDDYADTIRSDSGAEAEMDRVIGVISAVRNIRGEMNIPLSRKLDVTIHAVAGETREMLTANTGMIIRLARLDRLKVTDAGNRPETSATAIVADATVYVSLAGVIDFSEEIPRLERAIKKIDGEMIGLEKKLDNPNYTEKAPAEVVAKTREKHAGLLDKRRKLETNLSRIRSFAA